MYVERQVGDQCRRHALNALVQAPALDAAAFTQLAADWDALEPGAVGPQFESVHSDGRSFLSFAAERLLPLMSAQYVPLGAAEALRQDVASTTGQALEAHVHAYLEFNQGHVWACAQDEAKQWWRLDSLAGTPTRMPNPHLSAAHGYVLILPLQRAAELLIPVHAARLRRALEAHDTCGALSEDIETSLFAYLHLMQRALGGVPSALLPLVQSARAYYHERARANAQPCDVVPLARSLVCLLES
jgi:hypothetical protein